MMGVWAAADPCSLWVSWAAADPTPLPAAGEDPVLLAEYIAQYARGLQEGEDSRFTKLVSTAKHWSACVASCLAPARAPGTVLDYTPHPHPRQLRP